jgi:hypothetical protein
VFERRHVWMIDLREIVPVSNLVVQWGREEEEEEVVVVEVVVLMGG